MKVSANNNSENLSLMNDQNIEKIKDIGHRISEGARAFLNQEYKIILIFVIIFSVVVLLGVDIYGRDTAYITFYATFAFITGCLVSMFCG